ncbi:MAG TPA: TIM barrel protein [Candidatus Dormibacteraeota bacterium]|jgi:sugar phosphate isomerase/epimerase|nr:TIM barrel protein [Candidatus Dormibacteraeota bacterium]
MTTLHRVLCASGALGPSGETGIDEVLAWGHLLPVDGIEFLIRNSHRGRLEEILPQLRETGIDFPVVHLTKGVAARLPSAEAREELDQDLRFAAALGARLGVLHLWDLPDSDRDFDGRLAAYRIAREIAAEQGVDVGIESIPCTFASPLRNLRRLLDRYPDTMVVYDTEFLAAHGELEEALEDAALWRAVQHIHVKDFEESLAESDGRRRWRGPGEGAVDFRAVSAAIRDQGFAGAVSLEVGPQRPAEGPDRPALRRVLEIMATHDWDFGGAGQSATAAADWRG